MILSNIVNYIQYDRHPKSTTYLGRIDITRTGKIKAEEKIPYIRTRVCDRKAIGWNRMSDIIGYRSKQIIYVQITLCMM